MKETKIYESGLKIIIYVKIAHKFQSQVRAQGWQAPSMVKNPSSVSVDSRGPLSMSRKTNQY